MVINPGPAELPNTMPLQTLQIKIIYLMRKPTDLDLQYLPLRM